VKLKIKNQHQKRNNKNSEFFQNVLKIKCSKNNCFWVRESMDVNEKKACEKLVK
jgi:hypothetical protein